AGYHGYRFPPDEFEHQGCCATGFLKAEDRAEMPVIQRREHLRLASETRKAVGVSSEDIGQSFQRNVAIELRVARPIDLAHSAYANERNDLVRSDANAG